MPLRSDLLGMAQRSGLQNSVMRRLINPFLFMLVAIIAIANISINVTGSIVSATASSVVPTPLSVATAYTPTTSTPTSIPTSSSNVTAAIAVHAKLNSLYAPGFHSAPYPTSLLFDPYEEYRHILFDRVVTIMGSVILNEKDSVDSEINNKSVGTSALHLQNFYQSPVYQQQLSDPMEQSPLRKQQNQKTTQAEQLGYPKTVPGPIYSIMQPPGRNGTLQQTNIIKSPWFPAIPSEQCDGSYALVMKGTATLDLDELNGTGQYRVEVEIITDKLGLTAGESPELVSGKLYLGEQESDKADPHNNDDDGIVNYDDSNGKIPNTNVVRYGNQTRDSNVNNLDIEEIQNNCRLHVYNTQ